MAVARRLAGIAAAGWVALVAATPALARGEDPDWPCQQRLVPEVTAGAFWGEPMPEGAGDWRAEPRVAALVNRIAPRRIKEAEGVAAIGDFIAETDAAARRRIVPLVFLGLLEETNRQRAELIAHIKRFTRRQHELADLVNRLSAELHALPPDAAGEAAAQRAELEQRRFYLTKAFEDAGRTVRYACEGPVQLEARLGVYARKLQAGLVDAP